jgi:O-antigen ligase
MELLGLKPEVPHGGILERPLPIFGLKAEVSGRENMNNMISRTINYEKIRPCILVLLTALLAFFAGEGIFKVMAERTLGSILRHNLATIAVLFILFAFYNENFIPAIFNLKKIDLPSIKQAAPLVVFAVVSGIAVSVYGGLDIIYGGIIFFIALCLALSVFFIFSDKPFHAFCLFWLAYPFLYFIQTQGGSLGFVRPVIFDDLLVPFSSVYILILFCCAVLANLKKGTLFKDSNLRFIYWFILLAIPSLFFSKNPMKSAAYFAFDTIVPIMYFIFALNAIKDREQIGRAIQAILFSLLILIFITVYFFMKSGYEGGGLGLYESKGAMITFGDLASFSIIMFPFSFALYKITNKKSYLFLLPVFTALAVLSDGRSVALALLSVILLLFIFSKIDLPKKIFIAAVILVCLLFMLFLSYTLEIGVEIRHRLFSTISQLREGVDINEVSSGRVEIWGSALRMIKDHPIMGIGAGMWQDYAPLYKSREYMAHYEGYAPFFYSSIDAHNFFLDLYLKYGVLPVLLFSYFLFNILKKCFRAYKKETDNNAKRFIMASYISLLVWLILSMFDYRFYNYQVGTVLLGLFFWSIIGLSLKSVEMRTKQKESA